MGRDRRASSRPPRRLSVRVISVPVVTLDTSHGLSRTLSLVLPHASDAAARLAAQPAHVTRGHMAENVHCTERVNRGPCEAADATVDSS